MDQRPQAWDPACIPLRYLVTTDGSEADEAAVTDPSHWAVVLFEDTVLTDAETGELVDEDSVDWDTEGDSQATPDEGLRHANTVTETTMFVADYFCLDYRAAGQTNRRPAMDTAKRVSRTGGPGLIRPQDGLCHSSDRVSGGGSAAVESTIRAPTRTS